MLKIAKIVLIALIALVAIGTVHMQSAQAQSAWAPNTAYAVNALVTYGGATYKCIQAHTSLTGWEPPNVPALWGRQSGTVPTNTPGSNPTATRTRTNTPVGPTATRTRTPTPGGPTATRTRTATTAPTSQPPTGGNVLLGYFADWGVYARNYQPKNIVTSGSAGKLTHINFAFGNVTGGSCVMAIAMPPMTKLILPLKV